MFGDLFIHDCVLEQWSLVTADALAKRLKAVFAGVYESDIQMSMPTFYDPVVFAQTPVDKQGQDIPVLNASLLAAAHSFLCADARGLTVAKLYGTQSEVQEAHMKFEVYWLTTGLRFAKCGARTTYDAPPI